MNPRITLSPGVKRILYPLLLLVGHYIAENWSGIVQLLGPKYAWLGGPVVIGIGGVLLHKADWGKPNGTGT